MIKTQIFLVQMQEGQVNTLYSHQQQKTEIQTLS